MGRQRKAIVATHETMGSVAIFVHPLSRPRRTVRIPLGSGREAQENLRALNEIFLVPENWLNPPGRNVYIRNEWLSRVGDRDEKARGEKIPENEQVAAAQLVQATMLIEKLARENQELRESQILKDKQIEQLLRRKHHVGPWPSLGNALKAWTDGYTGRDPNHMKNVAWVLGTFVAHFGQKISIETLEGRERDIEGWLRGLDVTAGVRQQYRRYVLRFLKDSKLAIDASLISNPKRHEIRRDRGGIDWLDAAQADAVAGQLSGYWLDFWRVQLLTGMRPTELITVKKSDLRGDMLTLSPLGNLTLKVGPRTIQLPPAAREIVDRRCERCVVAFAALNRAGASADVPWTSDERFLSRYRAVLSRLKGLPFGVDARTARRTFASVQLRAGLSVEALAKYMGTSPDILREHYAAILPSEVRLKGSGG